MKQTAIEFLIKEIEKLTGLQFAKDEPCFLKAKELEKEQIQEAFYRGIQEQTQRVLFKNPEITEPDQYYIKTYENNRHNRNIKKR